MKPTICALRAMARCILVLLLGYASTTVAQAPAYFFAEPALDGAVLSGDGRFVAAVERLDDGGQALVIFDEQRRKRSVRAFHLERISSIHWLTAERLLVILSSSGQAAGMLTVNRNGSNLVRLFRSGGPGAGAQLVNDLPDLPSEIIVASDHRLAWEPDLYRVNLFTGAAELVERNPGRVYRWVTDDRGRVRAAMGWGESDQGVVYELTTRVRDDRPLRPAWSLPLTEGSFSVLGLHADQQRLLMQLDQPGEPSGLRLFDSQSKKFGELLVDARGRTIDVIRWAGEAKLPAWIETHGERPQRQFFSEEAKHWYARLDAHLGATENRVLGVAGGVALVLATNDRDPGSWWTYDIEADRLRRLGQRMPWYRPHRSTAMQPVSFVARDGQALTGYLSRPSDADGSLVLYPHGGPWSRDTWGFDPVVQFLTSRGHTVLQVNFRGSRGLGHEFMMLGQRQWGGAMQRDLVDALHWTIEQGHGEVGRIGLLGSSYGGFAALRLALDEPELIAAAAVFAPVIDLAGQIQHYRDQGHDRAVAEWTMMVGDPEQPFLQQISPLTSASELQRPVLMAHGRGDSTVPIAASERFAEEVPQRWLRTLWLENSGHALDDVQERERYYLAVERLFEDL